MLWEIEITPAENQPDYRAQSLKPEIVALGFSQTSAFAASYGYFIQGEKLSDEKIQNIADTLLTDPVVEKSACTQVDKRNPQQHGGFVVYVLPKPGVTDAVAESAKKIATDLGFEIDAVCTFRKYYFGSESNAAKMSQSLVDRICTKLLANEAIEEIHYAPLAFDALPKAAPYKFELKTVPIQSLSDSELQELSLKGQLYLSLTEMQTIRDFFVKQQRDPTDVELETLAQTWSEHCSHKTLAGRIEYTWSAPGTPAVQTRRFENMLKETIFAATVEIRKIWAEQNKPDWCVSVFSDNAGVVRFDDEYNVCFKVETHNHPSALEPYGGANTGLGGVIRDPMGTGMGAKPICSTDVFCFAPPEISVDDLPPGVLHPMRIIRGVVSGVRDYGNRMGIPTVNGAVYFDKRYLGNPLVYCGNVGILPHKMSFKDAKANDLIVAIGGRTGRDGIHGATFSSAELTSESETLSGGAVQIGNAITEKMVLDVMLEARDRGLYNAVTDCGAGGFSSAVGEMGENIGAEVDLDKIPLKYEGLSYTEMWISEAQERMVFAVPPEKWDEFRTLCESEDVEAVAIGVYRPTNRLVLKYQGTQVADLEMEFLHKGRPPVVRSAVYTPPEIGTMLECPLQVGITPAEPTSLSVQNAEDLKHDLFAILSSLNVASKHWIIHQYDHEVQAGTVVKPLVGVKNDGPGDATVVRPRLGSNRGIAISCGMNPFYGDYDTYWMAASAIDEAVRNCVAVGADPDRISILDNFCWGNTDRPETLGSLVRAAIACFDVATGFETPFISGKDSLNNEFRPEGAKEPISIPPSLLISAMGMVEDVSRCVTMDLKNPGNLLYQIGETKEELGGSHWMLVRGLLAAQEQGEKRFGQVPTLDIVTAKKTFRGIHQAICDGKVRSVHDLSEGGLTVALAESCFAGGLGAKISLSGFESKPHVLWATTVLFSESNSRFLCEVEPEQAAAFEAIFREIGVRCIKLGEVTAEPILVMDTLFEVNIEQLKNAWFQPLDW